MESISKNLLSKVIEMPFFLLNYWISFWCKGDFREENKDIISLLTAYGFDFFVS